MEENYINIAAILKEKPENIKLYSTLYGDVYFKEVCVYCDNQILVGHHGSEAYFKKDGRIHKDGEVCLFPSKEMRDWEKFAWKKGDVLDSDKGKKSCLFDGWKDDAYTEFFGKYHYSPSEHDEEDVWQFEISCKTADYHKSNGPDSFIGLLEEHEGGKLNLETLAIERDETKDLVGKFCYFEGKGLCIVSMLEKINDDTFEFGDCVSWKDGEPDNKQYSIKFKEPVKKENLTVLRRATKQEICEYMVTKGRHPFKTFDKVLVRDDDNNEWEPAFFLRMSKGNENYPYYCKALDSDCAESYNQCVPYKGCEHLVFTTNPF